VPQEADGLEALEKKLSSENLQRWISRLDDRNISLYLPKFRLETSYSMSQTLQALGMVRAFKDPKLPGGAQFDGMCASSDPQRKLYISAVLHKTFVEFNEQGTEAAAATAVTMGLGAAPPGELPFCPTIRADRPFLFAIRDVKTGTILFLGRVLNPKG
jgi:serpin B